MTSREKRTYSSDVLMSKPRKKIFPELTVQPILHASLARIVLYDHAQPITGQGGLHTITGNSIMILPSDWNMGPLDLQYKTT